jgi:predicted O-methyltransferase YrrM
MRASRFVHEVVSSPFYRRHPFEVIPYGYAKWRFGRTRVDTPGEMLERLGVDRDRAMAGLDNWLPLLSGVVSDVQRAQGQQGGVSMEDGLLLFGLTRAIKPQVVIETGVAAGVSSSFISAALIENGSGMLYSVELPPEHADRRQQDGVSFAWPERGVGWAIPAEISAGIGDRRVLVLDDVRHALPRLLGQLPQVDMFFHDDLHTPAQILWECELVWPELSTGGVLVVDDADFGWMRFARRHGLSGDVMCNLQRLTAARRTL